VKDDRVTGVVYHKSRRTAWKQSRHSYIIDVGFRIAIRQVQVSQEGEILLLVPPHPATRYFEVAIDESRAHGHKAFVFQTIFPVHAQRKPDLHILKLRIKRGGWMITERIPAVASPDEPQWIYNDDFTILFLSSGGRDDLDMLMSLITARLDAIAGAAWSGTPLLSQFESQKACRDVFGTMFSDGVDGAFRDTVLYQKHSAVPSGRQAVQNVLPAAGTDAAWADICAYHGRAAVIAGPDTVNLDQIEELNDLSWLFE
jgi:hypothetical protein